jgi:hypothetical protein
MAIHVNIIFIVALMRKRNSFSRDFVSRFKTNGERKEKITNVK